jgi:carbon storage regulator
MLVLSRKDSEQILIDDQICIKVLSIRGNTVRLGIEAPSSVSILRGEIVAELESTSSRPLSLLPEQVEPTALSPAAT